MHNFFLRTLPPKPPRDHMGNDLPYDVWLHVAKYLEPSTLAKLISLNRTFFDAALVMLYRDVKTSDVSRKIGQLRDPYIASRVRVLRLEISDHKSWALSLLKLYKGITSMPRRAVIMLGIVSPSKVSFLSDPCDLTDMPDYVFNNMAGLTSLELESWSRLPCYAARCIVPRAWSILGSRLQALTLRLSPWNFQCLIPPTLVFPNLETLAIEIISSCDELRKRYGLETHHSRIVSTTLLPFIKRHRPTLTSFALSHYGPSLSGSSLIPLGMGYFPRLKKLSFGGIDEPPQGLIYIWDILGLHAEQLEEIYIQRRVMGRLPMYHGPALARNPSFSAKFTHHIYELEDLGPIASQLTSLELSRTRRYYYGVRDVIRVLTPYTRIHDLSMEVEVLSPEIIDLFAERMSHIRHLTLFVESLAVAGTTPIRTEVDSEAFCAILARRRYPDWKLEEFDLIVGTRIPNNCNEALSRIFPRIQVKFDPQWNVDKLIVVE